MDFKRSEGYDPGADIRGLKKGEFQADLAFGLVGEEAAARLVEAMLSGAIEVKTDGYENDNLFIELAQCPGRLVDEKGDFIWRRSGLNTTEAKYYIYIKQAPNGSLRSQTVFETDRLKRFKRKFYMKNGFQIMEPGFHGTGYLIGNRNGEIPTLGLRIAGDDVDALRFSALYD
jgi:hypothetical protein